MSNERCQMIRSLPLAVLTLCSCHHHIIAAGIHLVRFQRPRRRATNVLSAKVVLPVMTSTPNLLCIIAILDDALEVRTDSGKCFELSCRCMNQDAALVSVREHYSLVDRQFTDRRS